VEGLFFNLAEYVYTEPDFRLDVTQDGGNDVISRRKVQKCFSLIKIPLSPNAGATARCRDQVGTCLYRPRYLAIHIQHRCCDSARRLHAPVHLFCVVLSSRYN